MSELPQFYAASMPDAGIIYAYNDVDDMKSLRRVLARAISPTAAGGAEPDVDAGEAWLYLVPDYAVDREAPKFQRPAVTIQLLDTQSAPSGPKMGFNYSVEHLMTITAYGRTRPETIALARKVWVALEDSLRSRADLWATDFNARLARKLRVLSDSLSMGFADTDDQGKWERPLELRVRAPRMREVLNAPILQSVGASGTTSG